ncbi:hypothetical protein [Mucilaginibacter paludis]|uniref:Uncharacterized protein n=1 Tax=Mucilaginibacter paludis DSM 18603 TaxID=714943 RepID=H1Y8G9_9SPHI|nr:hypothetical protein [Mucilaginibacter paludis]EHQ25887.1 hypothetical protein Mucpa_1733 [Mucilaginibacter paludis DSM 18603]
MSEFPVYKEQVLADYDRKIASQELSSKLIHITPGNLKKESVRVCEERFLPKDKHFLRPIFGQKDDASGYRNAIQNGNANPFRPLVNFLRDRSINTDENNIELLAWLINFEPRPYMTWLKDPNRNHKKEEHEAPDQTPDEDIVVEPEKNKKQPDEDQIAPPLPAMEDDLPKPFLNGKKIIILVAFWIVLGGGIYLIKYEGEKPLTKNTEKLNHIEIKKNTSGCMVWNKDHYEQGSCDQTNDGRLIVKLDPYRLAHLKKITDTSNINWNSIGHTWYFRAPKEVECFTAAGPYPPDTTRRLLPITEYIIRKYFHW